MNYIFQFGDVFKYTDTLLMGALTTLVLTFATTIIGVAIGILGAAGRTSGSRLWGRCALGYVEFIRNTPFIIQLFFVYFGLPALGLRLEALTAALFTLVINLGAYSTEIVRAGIEAVPLGQRDAGAALGLTRWQIMRLIVLKPALKIVFPALASQFTLLMLATSILSQIGIEELFHMASIVDTTTYRSFEVYAVTCGFYLAAALAFRLLFAIVHRLAFAERVFAGATPGAARPAVGSVDIVVPP